jgi:hypothetical protein
LPDDSFISRNTLHTVILLGLINSLYTVNANEISIVALLRRGHGKNNNECKDTVNVKAGVSKVTIVKAAGFLLFKCNRTKAQSMKIHAYVL